MLLSIASPSHFDCHILASKPEYASDPILILRHNSIITAVFGQASASLRTAVTLASERSMTGLTPDGFYCLLDRLSPVSKRMNAIRSNPNDPLVCRAS